MAVVTIQQKQIERGCMSKLSLRNLIILLFSFTIVVPTISQAKTTQESIVKVFTTSMSYNYNAPWQTNALEECSGSGCIISGKRILTNAHVVSNATFIEIQRHGDPARFTAKVIAISHEADLALLQVEEDAFFNNTTPIELGGLPNLLDEVFVYGFPEGGEGLSVTKGIISRIEITQYIHSFLSLLGLQIDAAINNGNSGGPVIMDGKIVGVAMQTREEAENIGYIIPVSIIEHFLTDLKDGRYDGFPYAGVISQSLRNAALKKSLNFPDSETGVYVSAVIPGTATDGLIFPGDVILSIDNHKVANDGTVLVRSGLRVQSDYYIVDHQIGENAIFEVWRNGSKQNITVPLTSKQGNSLYVTNLPQYDCQPEYYILGGIIFTPLICNYLKTLGTISEAPGQLLRYLYEYKKKAEEEAVIISGLLTSKMTTGYQDAVDERIVSVNGQSITNFKSFTAIVNKALKKDEFITLKTESHSVIVVSPQEHRKNEKKLLELYGIDKPCRIK